MHHRDTAFIIPNPYDVGTAKLLQHIGFEALATSSAGYAFTLGKPDNYVGRNAMLAHVAEVVTAVDIPVSADLENCFADDADGVAETIKLAAHAGLAGCSIEDMAPGGTIYVHTEAVERVRAAAEAAQGLPFTFTLTARCENFLVGRPDLDDTIKRLHAYGEAGADVLYAPGLRNREEIEAVVRSLDKPVNVIMGSPGLDLTLDELSEIGVKRVSVGSGLTRAALGSFIQAARTIKEKGTFDLGENTVPFAELTKIFSD